MKIAITGAHQVGKTTLAEQLQAALPDYELKAEPYHELEASGYVFAETPDVDDFMVQLEHAIRQISTSSDQAIFDRCPLDLLAYIQAMDESENIPFLYHQVQQAMTDIDLLVFVPIEDPDVVAGREVDLPELRDEVNALLQDWVWDFGMETLEVSGTLAARSRQVLDKIKLLEV